MVIVIVIVIVRFIENSIISDLHNKYVKIYNMYITLLYVKDIRPDRYCDLSHYTSRPQLEFLAFYALRRRGGGIPLTRLLG